MVTTSASYPRLLLGLTFIVFISMAAALISGAQIAMYIDMKSMLLVPALTFGLATLRSRWSKSKASLVDIIPSSAAYAGLICVSVALTYVLFNMDNPAKIGPGIAVAYLSLFYGAMFALTGYAFQLSLGQTVDNLETQSKEDRIMTMTIILALVLAVAIAISYQVFPDHLATAPTNFLFSVLVTPIMFAGVVQISIGIPSAIERLGQDATKSSAQAELIRLFAQTAVLTGLLGFIIGQVSLMANLSDPSMLSKAFAVTVGPMFYGIVFSLAACLLLPEEESNPRSNHSNVKRILATVVASTLGYSILVTAFKLIMIALETTAK